ncbi:MAG: DUF3662 domain-containing protein [Anaerolineaceae bacterium]|nr:DUF3662 domain-containing protein [Anaerolineaceae bacterium]
MKLDQIEARLQALIESSVALFARGDAQRRLAHQLVAAAQENIIIEQDNRAIAPNLYTIFLHPESLDYWQEHGRLLDAIGRSLMDAAREYEVYFHNEPILRLVADANLPLEGIQVTAADQHEVVGHTTAFSAVPTTPQQNSIPHNAFVIVEGNRTFLLNRMVINIGRRPDNHLVLSDPRVSRAHAQIRAIRGQYVIFDLNSTGGTLVNGRRINQCALKPGDVISLSGVPLIYGEDTPLGDDETQEYGFTRSMNNPPKNEPPEIIE